MYRLINQAFDRFNSRSPVLVQTPYMKNIGNCAEEIYFGLLKAQREHKKVLFLFLQHPMFWKFALPVANKELLQLESAYIVPNNRWYSRLGAWLLTIVYSLMRVTYAIWRSPRLRRMIRIIWPHIQAVPFPDSGYTMPKIGQSVIWCDEGIDHFSWDVVERYRWKEQFKEYQPPRLSEDKHKKGEQFRVQMGIPSADWFVCLHARESGFRKDDATYRNGSINNYVEGIKVITDAGGWVVRLGDSTMTPLPPMERVIDYPHTLFKSELMDIYLISQCRFFVGAVSGLFDVATLFAKPIIIVNSPEWTVGFPLKKGSLLIIKHVFPRSRNRFLSIKELVEEPFGGGLTPFQWQMPPGPDEYILVENTAEEIRNVIEEFLAQPEVAEHSELQQIFCEARKAQHHQWLVHERWVPESSKEAPFVYRVAARVDSAEGAIGQRYLEQNWLEDNLGIENLPVVQTH